MANKYIVDSNVFIQGKNFHYDFAFCVGFWDWIEAGYNAGVIFSVRKVRDELLKGKKGDLGRDWAMKMPMDFFLDDAGDAAVMKSYAEAMVWAARDVHYLPAARAKFADVDKADAFLLAYAKTYGHQIVTQEHSNPAKRKEIPIPDAAIKLGGIQTLTIYQLLTTHAKPTFLFKP
ncbi:conserved hypothetical protein [Luteimonas sp. 9C]|uniref:DUF4411 family protein n=1 Tax=Luteimonas sp. 9C TaxID=2653148 RepID=UPI0012F1841D|nr:DUF4411 family protein [Luteimonas sp. 9C]VXC14268.1 conserved hypothetical protein [Luteimonas sp. 9C]